MIGQPEPIGNRQSAVDGAITAVTGKQNVDHRLTPVQPPLAGAPGPSPGMVRRRPTSLQLDNGHLTLRHNGAERVYMVGGEGLEPLDFLV